MPKRTPVTADYYGRLQVHPAARPEVIEAAYRALARIHHPDHGGSEDAFKLIGEAHDVLGDPTKRSQYDQERQPTKGSIVGQYRLLDKIAEGGFGNTYKAEHLVNGELDCIKFCTNVTPEYFDLLVEESQAVWNLRNYALPGIRTIIHLDDGSYALVMSYIPGPTLAQVIEKIGKVDPEHVAWIAERVLSALRYIHYHAVVHGDIKPQNIIVQPKKHMAALVDFGLSAVRPTRTTVAKGFTKVFAAPEQVAGRPPLPETDFYCLGMTMLYALNGGDVDRVNARQIEATVPKPLKLFVQSLIRTDVASRPRWPDSYGKEDVIDLLVRARRESFGREQSQMKPIPGFETF